MSIDVTNVCTLLQVFDMPRSLAFYRDVLGFEVISASSPGDECDWCLLRLGGAELMLNTRYERHERPPAPDPVRVAAHDDTALFFGCRDLDAAFEHIRSRGVDVMKLPVVTPYGMRQLTLADPDGYVICFQWPARDTEASPR